MIDFNDLIAFIFVSLLMSYIFFVTLGGFFNLFSFTKYYND